jgi:hypothetical protein
VIDMPADMPLGLLDNCSLFTTEFNKIWKLSKQFSRFRSAKFHENPLSCLPGVAPGRTSTQTDRCA